MKQPINEVKRMQQLAGILKEEEYDFISDYNRDAVDRPLSDYEKRLVGQEPFQMKGNYVPKSKTIKSPEPTEDQIAKEIEQIDTITQELINGGFFTPRETESGEMFDSFTKGKLKHNEEIRNAIDRIAAENNWKRESWNRDEAINKYWHKFW
jgi:hypothetical protein